MACDFWTEAVAVLLCVCSSLLVMFLTLSADVTLGVRWGLPQTLSGLKGAGPGLQVRDEPTSQEPPLGSPHPCSEGL